MDGLRRSTAALRDGLRVRLWPVPALGLLVAVVLALVLPRIDARVDFDRHGWLSPIVFDGDGEAARAMLETIASSLITVTSLTFSLTVVTLQLASSQHSPRLLRTFSRDLVVQLTLGLFLSTFVFALVTLRAVRAADAETAVFVPRIAVSVAYVLALLSVLALVVFLTHLVRQIRVETMLRNVHAEAASTVAAVLGGREGPSVAPSVPAGARLLLARSSGFLVGIDHAGLRRAASAAEVVVLIQTAPGSSIVKGVPVGWAWSAREQVLDDGPLEHFTDALDGVMNLGYERTAAQDLGYGLRQLADVAVRALSPGVNDPTTAAHALGHISALLGEIGSRPLGPTLLHDDDGTLRACLTEPSWAELLDEALGQIRRYGCGDPHVVRRLLRVLAELAWCTPQDRHASIAEHLSRVRRAAAQATEEPADLRSLEEEAERVVSALAGRWLGGPPSDV